MSNKSLLMVLVVLQLCSCTGSSRTETVGVAAIDFLKSIEKYNDNSEEEFGVIIIPGTACGTCIARTLDNINNNLGLMDNITLIYTSYVSLKGFRLKYGEGIFTHENFVADRGSDFYKFSKSVSTPVMLYFKGGKAVQMDIVSLKNVDEVFNTFNSTFG